MYDKIVSFLFEGSEQKYGYARYYKEGLWILFFGENDAMDAPTTAYRLLLLTQLTFVFSAEGREVIALIAFDIHQSARPKATVEMSPPSLCVMFVCLVFSVFV